jgi:hypothetical protein
MRLPLGGVARLAALAALAVAVPQTGTLKITVAVAAAEGSRGDHSLHRIECAGCRVVGA